MLIIFSIESFLQSLRIRVGKSSVTMACIDLENPIEVLIAFHKHIRESMIEDGVSKEDVSLEDDTIRILETLIGKPKMIFPVKPSNIPS